MPRVAFEKLPVLTGAHGRHLPENFEASQWEEVRREPPKAELVTECLHTKHPYQNAVETLEVHQIRGAKSLELSFDRRSSTYAALLGLAPRS